ncbi:MAG: hypothetical protein QOI31_1151 [Solirubrobacterales bacterium]|jgi:hypothetical protein|nr:hypothetical protein [Solirubrobacterales bacterium]
MNVRLAVLPIALIVLVLNGCGEDEAPTPNPDADSSDALAAAADWVEAVLAGDAQGACAVLTPQGQADVALAVDRAPHNDPVGDSCDEALDSIFLAHPVPTKETPKMIDAIRSDGRRVRSVIDSDQGSVIIGSMRIDVERINGEWLVSDGIDTLFGLGVDPLPEDH